MHRSILIQWLAASLLTLSVPLCCCQGLLGVLMTGNTGQSSVALTNAEQFARASDGHTHVALSTSHVDESAVASSQHSHDSGPCQDEAQCECEQLLLLAQPNTQVSSSLPAAQSFLIQPALATHTDWHAHTVASTKNASLRTGQPLASPLHLHCALTV